MRNKHFDENPFQQENAARIVPLIADYYLSRSMKEECVGKEGEAYSDCVKDIYRARNDYFSSPTAMMWMQKFRYLSRLARIMEITSAGRE